MAYNSIPLDLTAGLVRAVVAPRNAAIAQISVRALPADATLQLHIGSGADPVTVYQGDTIDCCPAERGGLFATAPAQPNVIAEIYVSYAESAGGAA